MIWATQGPMLWPESTAQRDRRQSRQRNSHSPCPERSIPCSPKSRKRFQDQPELSMYLGDPLYLKFLSGQMYSNAIVWKHDPWKTLSSSTWGQQSSKIASARTEATFSLVSLLPDESKTSFWKPPACKHRTQNAFLSTPPHKHIGTLSGFFL